MTIAARREYLGIVFCIACLSFATMTQHSNATLSGWILILLYVCCGIAVINKNGKRPYPFFVFVLYCFMSNAGQTLTHLLGLTNNLNVDIYRRYDMNLIAEMLLIQGWFISFMVVGYLCLRNKKEYVYKPVSSLSGQHISFQLNELILICLAIIVGLTYFQEMTLRFSMSYGEYYYTVREGLGTVMQYIYHVYVYTYFLNHTGWKRKFAFSIILILAIMSIFIGSRSATIPMLVGILYIIMVSKTKIRIKPRYLLVGFLLLIVFSAFTDLRSYSLSDLSGLVVLEAVLGSPITALKEIVQEMGGSARTVLSTMEGLRNGVVHHEGTILYSLLKGVFPISVLNIFGFSEPSIPSLSAWVSVYGSGPYVLGRGWGYSIIAEIIFNFGYWGVIFSFIFGSIMAFAENLIERLLEKKMVYLAAGILYVLGYAVFLARAETTLMATRIRYTVYLAIGFWLYSKMARKRRDRNAVEETSICM
jgi:hypothetical protein